MKLIVNIIGIVVALNTIVLTYLTYLYFKNKDNTLQDDGATDTEQEN
jgi:hypothetical protein